MFVIIATPLQNCIATSYKINVRIARIKVGTQILSLCLFFTNISLRAAPARSMPPFHRRGICAKYSYSIGFIGRRDGRAERTF